MRVPVLAQPWSLAGTMTASSMGAAARQRPKGRPNPAALVRRTSLCMLDVIGTLTASALSNRHLSVTCAATHTWAAHAESMALSVDILRGIKRKGYQLPTPIQRKAMPLILGGSDVVGMARTGSGKTAAFVLPMLQR